MIRAVTVKVGSSQPFVGQRVGNVNTSPWCPYDTPSAYQALSDDANGGDAELMAKLSADCEHGRAKGGVSALYVCHNPLPVLLKRPHVSDVLGANVVERKRRCRSQFSQISIGCSSSQGK